MKITAIIVSVEHKHPEYWIMFSTLPSHFATISKEREPETFLHICNESQLQDLVSEAWEKKAGMKTDIKIISFEGTLLRYGFDIWGDYKNKPWFDLRPAIKCICEEVEQE